MGWDRGMGRIVDGAGMGWDGQDDRKRSRDVNESK